MHRIFLSFVHRTESSAWGMMTPKAWMKPTIASWVLQIWRENVLVQTQMVARPVHDLFRQVRKIVVVTCGKHNGVHLWEEVVRWSWTMLQMPKFFKKGSPLTSAVVPSVNTTVDLFHIRFHNDWKNLQRQIIVDHWDLTEESNEMAKNWQICRVIFACNILL